MDNLFKYATSELSNDAFLCWLISASKGNFKTNTIEYKVSQEYLKKFSKYEGKITVSEIIRQEKNIDIIIKGYLDNNEKFIIAIENKIDSVEHSSQLIRYRTHINEKYKYIKENNRNFVYYKTAIQGEIEHIKKEGYLVFQIYEIYDLLTYNQASKSNNQILIDYYRFVKDKYESYESFKDNKINNWTQKSFIGFFNYLSKKLNENKVITWKGFGYNDNMNGGHWTLWFGNNLNKINNNKEKIGFHLNLEQQNHNSNNEWVCRLIIRANGHINGLKYKKSDINEFIGTIGNTIRHQPSKHIILSKLFEINKDSNINYESLEEKIILGINEYDEWQTKYEFK